MQWVSHNIKVEFNMIYVENYKENLDSLDQDFEDEHDPSWEDEIYDD